MNIVQILESCQVLDDAPLQAVIDNRFDYLWSAHIELTRRGWSTSQGTDDKACWTHPSKPGGPWTLFRACQAELESP